MRVPAHGGAQARLTLTSRLLIEYDGSGFSGWAAQPGLRTVQGELEKALAALLHREVQLTVAGRTDTGVHARGQVASHEGEPATVRGLNALLPDDIGVLESAPTHDGFDARRDAKARTYRYRVLARAAPSPFERRRALHWPHAIEREALYDCAAAVTGTHDFTAFTPTQTDHVRFDRDVMRAEWLEEPDGVLAFWIEADTFMRHMVRTLVGSMLWVARGRFDVGWFEGLLDGRPRSDAGDTAPPYGLYLESVRY